jgi:DNA-binding response OmpR family regulator
MKIKVLVVDDECPVADCLAGILALQGYDVRTAYCGADALKLAGEFCPDVLVSDVMMPDISGFEVAVQIRKCLPECRVLLVSGAPDRAILTRKAQKKYAQFELFAKPLDVRVLLSRLRSDEVT